MYSLVWEHENEHTTSRQELILFSPAKSYLWAPVVGWPWDQDSDLTYRAKTTNQISRNEDIPTAQSYGLVLVIRILWSWLRHYIFLFPDNMVIDKCLNLNEY